MMRLYWIATITFATIIIIVSRSALAASSGTAATTVDPCMLVAQSDAAQAMGSTQPAVAYAIPAGKFCHYQSSDQRTNIFVQNVNPQVMATLQQMGATSVSGIGDAAYIYRTSIYVEKGSNVVQIDVYSNSLDNTTYTTELTSLATLAASRM
jgi:hypothetical protein